MTAGTKAADATLSQTTLPPHATTAQDKNVQVRMNARQYARLTEFRRKLGRSQQDVIVEAVERVIAEGADVLSRDEREFLDRMLRWRRNAPAQVLAALETLLSQADATSQHAAAA